MGELNIQHAGSIFNISYKCKARPAVEPDKPELIVQIRTPQEDKTTFLH